MKLFWRRNAHWITWILIVLAVAFWVITIVGWVMTEPGFEPINVVVSAVVSLLAAMSKRLSRAPDDVGFTISSSGINLSDGGIRQVDGGFCLASELTLSFRAKVCVHNSSSPASVRLRIASIGPRALSRCLPEDVVLQDIDLKVKYKKRPNWAAVDLGNPFIAEAGDRHIETTAKIPLSVRKIQEAFGALAALKEMEVILEADLDKTGTRLSVSTGSLDLSLVHAKIVADAVAMIPRYPVRSTRPIDTVQLVLSLKRYWTGTDDTT